MTVFNEKKTNKQKNPSFLVCNKCANGKGASEKSLLLPDIFTLTNTDPGNRV